MVLMMASIASAQQSNTAPNVNAIVARMMAARQENRARVKAYTVKRDYELLDKQSNPKAQVIATITVLSADQKQYFIESSSGGMGEKVLRDILTKETEPVSQAERKEVTRDNYDFQLLGQEVLDGHNCYVVSLLPKREDRDLIKGKMWIDAATYNVRRVEGNPGKSPSWWIRDVHIVMNFASVDGMWLHTATHAVADVRFKGKYVMESRDLEYRPVEETASARTRKNHGLILAGAALSR
jgi:outer membrane lipoprotein-sorting protein